MAPVIIIGYSGHAWVALDIFQRMGIPVLGYMDVAEKSQNPFNLPYLGSEKAPGATERYAGHPFFVGIGNNSIRQQVQTWLTANGISMVNAVHPDATISGHVPANSGIMIGARAVIQTQAVILAGVICNTGCIIEHECNIGAFAHVAPGAVLAGNTTVGDCTMIGAAAVVRQGITIGNNTTVGAGSVVIRDIPSGTIVAGNPAKPIKTASQ